jgi:hypothetical protein
VSRRVASLHAASWLLAVALAATLAPVARGEEAGGLPATRSTSERDPLATPAAPLGDRAATERALERFLAGSREGVLDPVPWPLEPSHVDAFLARALRDAAPRPGAARKLAMLARTYLLSGWSRDVVASLGTGRRSSAADAWLAAAAAWVEPDALPEALHAAYARIVDAAIRDPQAELDPLLAMRDAFGPRLASDPLPDALRARAARLRAKSSPADLVEAATLEDALDGALQELAGADAGKRAVRERATPDERLSLLLDIQLERTDFGGEQYLLPWSALAIRRQAQDRGRVAVVEGVRAKLASLPASDGASTARIRLLHALEYFGAALSPEEQALLSEHGAGQLDELSREALAREQPSAGPTPRRGR